MKVVCMYEYGGPEVLKVKEVERPSPGMNEVLIQVKAIGINYAEVQQRKGVYPYPLQLPTVLGQWAEVAGEVVEVGEGVSQLQAGMQVISQVPQGAYAEYVAVPAGFVLPAPPSLTPAQSTALLTQGQTAYHTLKTAGRLQTGETVLIHAAAGGVGHLAVQIAKALHAGQIIGTASTPAKLEVALSLGADAAINYTDPNWTEQVLACTGGRGVDLILDMAGGEILQGSLRVLAPFGRLVYFGSASAVHDKWDQADLVRLLENKSIIGFNIAHLLTSRPEQAKAGLEHLYELMGTGRLKPLVQHRFPLDQAGEAHRLLEARQTSGTVVLVP
ncbi:quinone oxidoreductase family protein [Paenibacillus puerhi]|uniref:quinone oxidoreductase family protein n=1 Tax=Paenibacillus puerhi TaxID=2692622 RepID=UPI00135AD509|nr:zinc-binding dehydrogenase [Paenibacillus puerhi]